MVAEKSVIVIGAGFAGLSAASFMAKEGWKVTVLEKNSTPGGRACQLKEEGFTVLNDTPKQGADHKLVAFLHPKTTNGVLIELCQEIRLPPTREWQFKETNALCALECFFELNLLKFVFF